MNTYEELKKNDQFYIDRIETAVGLDVQENREYFLKKLDNIRQILYDNQILEEYQNICSAFRQEQLKKHNQNSSVSEILHDLLSFISTLAEIAAFREASISAAFEIAKARWNPSQSNKKPDIHLVL